MKSLSQIVLIAVTVASIAVAVFLIVRQTSSDGMEIILPVPTAERELELKVHIAGAVRRPDVYPVTEGDRLKQVIEAAGGTTTDADLTALDFLASCQSQSLAGFDGRLCIDRSDCG